MRRLRHWKQQYEPNAQFVWRKPVLWDGVPVEIGGKICEALASNKNRLRRFWEAQIIELMEFEAPEISYAGLGDRKPEVEEPKAERPKAEEPKAEEPKAEEPKAEEPKAEEPKAIKPKTKLKNR